jgi:8-oxo-dGTP pyrophosphatase MutT (NUDIX family)
MITPWTKLSSKSLGDFRIFKIRDDLKQSPRTGKAHDFMILECPDWVNVIAVTPDQQLVMVEQYRHGTNTVELEIPGGVIDPTDATPLAAGLRELREETGYEGENARILGHVYSNPAIMNNTCHTVIVENCRLRHGLELDGGEDIHTRLVPIDQIPALIANNKIGHSLVVVALYQFDVLRRKTSGTA